MSTLNKLNPPIYIKAMRSDLDYPNSSLHLESLGFELMDKQAVVILNHLKNNFPYEIKNHSFIDKKLCTVVPLVVFRQVFTPPVELMLEQYVCKLPDYIREELSMLSNMLDYTRDWRAKMVDEIMIMGSSV